MRSGTKGSTGKKTRARGPSVRALAATVGRGAIWATLGLLLLKGLGSVVAPAEPEPVAASSTNATDEPGVDAFAVRFARAYLADPSAEALAPFMAEGARVGTGLPPKLSGASVAQAEVSFEDELGGGESVLTVACELHDGRTLYLAVPTIDSGTGEVAATGAPWLVAGPGTAGAGQIEHPQTLVGADGPAIESLVAKFLPVYLAAASPEELSYFVSPGTTVQPLSGVVGLKSLAGVTQLGDGEGPRRTVLAAVRVTDPVGGSTWPLVYRLDVERGGQGDRWYVAGVEGVSA